MCEDRAKRAEIGAFLTLKVQPRRLARDEKGDRKHGFCLKVIGQECKKGKQSPGETASKNEAT